jgi:hypothetical protein
VLEGRYPAAVQWRADHAAMPESIDEIPLGPLLILDGNGLIFDGPDPGT